MKKNTPNLTLTHVLLEANLEMVRRLTFLLEERGDVYRTSGGIALCEWVETEVICRLFHLSRKTLCKYRAHGVIPYSRIEGKFYYRLTDFTRLLEENYTRE